MVFLYCDVLEPSAFGTANSKHLHVNYTAVYELLNSLLFYRFKIFNFALSNRILENGRFKILGLIWGGFIHDS